MLDEKFSSEELDQLKKDFSNLETVEQKLQFWNNSLKFVYEENPFSPTHEAFKIKCETPEEIEYFNKHFFQKAFESDLRQSERSIFTIDFLTENFNKKINEIPDKKKFILSEIRRIEHEIALKSIPPVINQAKRSNSFISSISDKINKKFIEAYNDFYLYGKEPDLSLEVIPTTYLIALNNGQVYAEYHNFLNTQLSNIKLNSKSEVTTLPKQLLMLHYMGILKEFSASDRKVSKLLGTLLNANPDNLRKELPNFIGNKLQEIKNEKHLNELIILFNETGLSRISKAIENDIVRFKERK